MCRPLFLIVFILFCKGSFAQSILVDKVRVQTDDESVVAFIKPVKNNVQADPLKHYYWYSAGRLKTTQGGYSGKLLNGTYESFYLNKSIKEQGKFKKGLKQGLWKTWYEDGSLKELAEWKSGEKNGDFQEFDEQGKRIQAGSFKKGKLNGKLLKYHGIDSVEVSNYKNGLLQVKKEKTPKTKTENFFKRTRKGLTKLPAKVFKNKKRSRKATSKESGK